MVQSLTRDEILRRYRRWRQLRIEIQSAAMKNVSPAAFLKGAKRIGLADGNTIIANSEEELTLACDLALYSAGAGTTRAIDRCARMWPNRDPEEALVLQALCASRFSLFRVIAKHELIGVLLKDAMRGGGELWLLDEGLEQCVKPGEFLATRAAPIEGFVVTCGAVIPFDKEMAEGMEVFPGSGEAISAILADDRRFPEQVYRIAIERGQMSRVTYQ
jgi:hypothetical protein